jgi:hypothetical protein
MTLIRRNPASVVSADPSAPERIADEGFVSAEQESCPEKFQKLFLLTNKLERFSPFEVFKCLMPNA